MKILKTNNFIGVVVCLLAILLLPSEVWAAVTAKTTVFSQVAIKAGKFLHDLKAIVYVLGGFGIICFAVMAIFNKISWGQFANIAMGLFLVSAMGMFISFFVTKDGKDFPLSYGDYLSSGVFTDTKGEVKGTNEGLDAGGVDISDLTGGSGSGSGTGTGIGTGIGTGTGSGSGISGLPGGAGDALSGLIGGGTTTGCSDDSSCPKESPVCSNGTCKTKAGALLSAVGNTVKDKAKEAANSAIQSALSTGSQIVYGEVAKVIGQAGNWAQDQIDSLGTWMSANTEIVGGDTWFGQFLADVANSGIDSFNGSVLGSLTAERQLLEGIANVGTTNVIGSVTGQYVNDGAAISDRSGNTSGSTATQSTPGGNGASSSSGTTTTSSSSSSSGRSVSRDGAQSDGDANDRPAENLNDTSRNVTVDTATTDAPDSAAPTVDADIVGKPGVDKPLIAKDTSKDNIKLEKQLISKDSGATRQKFQRGVSALETAE